MHRFLIGSFLTAILFAGFVWADNPHNLPATPVVVGQFDFQNQTTVIPQFTAYSPTADGNFRLTFYGDMQPDTTSGGVVCFEATWTDDLVTHTSLFASLPITDSSVPPQFSSSAFSIHAVANSSITILGLASSNAGCTPPRSVYNVYFTLEKLD